MKDAARMYRESAVRCASPVGLIVILYEEVIRSLRKAQQACERKDVEQRILAVSHAIRIIGYLQSVLNFELGGEVAQNLSHFYNVSRSVILKSSKTGNSQGLASLAADFSSLAQTWQQVDRAVSSRPQGETHEAALVSAIPSLALNETETSLRAER